MEWGHGIMDSRLAEVQRSMQMQFLKVGYESESLSGVLFDDLMVFVSWVQLGFVNFGCLNSELMFVFLFIVLVNLYGVLFVLQV